MDQSWWKTSLILGPVFAIMMGAGYYLWLDYQKEVADPNSQAQKELFGTISFVNNNVKRKSNDTLLWSPLGKDEPLYYLDAIRTGADSYAVIKLRDNSIIELNENSLIVLEKRSNLLSVDFKTGDLRTKGTSAGLLFKVKDSTIEAHGADIKLKTDAQKSAQVLVTKGRAVVQDGKKQRRELDSDSQMNIDAAGKSQTTSISLTLLTPNDRALFLSPQTDIKSLFTWAVKDKNLREEVLEVSQDPGFSHARTVSVKAHQAATAKIKRGKNYWRVGWQEKRNVAGTVSGPLNYSEIRTLNVDQDQRVTLLTPANDTTFDVTPDESEVEFTWKADSKPKSFVLELADTASFERIRQTNKMTIGKFRAANLPAGHYYWRVSALGEKNEDLGQSSPYHLEVRHTLSVLPTLLKPDEGYLWTDQSPVRMDWRTVEKADRYKLVISRDKEQKLIVKATTVTTPFYSWVWPKPGAYFWSIQSIAKNQVAFTQSLVRPFTIAPAQTALQIALTLPANQAEVNRERKEPVDAVSFEWTADKLEPANFTLMISQTPGFEKFLKTADIQKNRVSVRLPETSTYYWKVLWNDPKDPTKTETSATFTIRYAIAPGLPSPELLSPLKSANVKTEGAQPIELTWKPVTKAMKYRVVLERFDVRLNNRLPVFDKIIADPKLITSALSEGTYEWKVYTIDEKDIQGLPSETRPFQVQVKEALMAPKLKPLEIK